MNNWKKQLNEEQVEYPVHENIIEKQNENIKENLQQIDKRKKKTQSTIEVNDNEQENN